MERKLKMLIDDYVTVIHTKNEERVSYPIFCNMRDMSYIDAATEFLSVKAEGKLHYWFQSVNLDSTDPTTYPIEKYKTLRPLKQNTVDQYGKYLGMFLRWCENKGQEAKDIDRYSYLNLETLNSSHCGSLEEYADDLKSGNFLNIQTAANYQMHMTIANEFLMFLYATKRRDKPYTPFNIIKPRRDFGNKAHEIKHWQIPTPSELKNWIASLKSEEDQLIAELVCYSGFRAGDVYNLKIDAVPNLLKAKDTGENDRVFFDVFDGKYSKARTTTMPRGTLEKLNYYIRKIRRKRLKALNIKSDYVFVSTQESNRGNQFSKAKLEYLFKRNSFDEDGQPHSNWRPHMGRHAFACHRLVELMVNDQIHFDVTLGDALAHTMMHEGALAKLQFEMGHVSAETTSQYLSWANRHKLELKVIEGEVRNLDYQD